MLNPRKKLTVMQKAKIGAGIGLVVFVVLWEKKRVNTIVTFLQNDAMDKAWESFDTGVQYGVILAQHAAEGDVFAKEDVKEYAFKAFDKAS